LQRDNSDRSIRLAAARSGGSKKNSMLLYFGEPQRLLFGGHINQGAPAATAGAQFEFFAEQQS
jgi:hypothetical protein